jgi:2-polyprenyl-6-methoxyphenol hydroxylase-like FAD-dependent oxidoreductase
MHTQVAVIGGGIGGLGAALSLLRAGLDVHVYEQAQALREVGAGQVSPNASRVLHGLGLADKLAELGVRPGHLLGMREQPSFAAKRLSDTKSAVKSQSALQRTSAAL